MCLPRFLFVLLYPVMLRSDTYPCGVVALFTLLHGLGYDVTLSRVDTVLGHRSFHSMAEIQSASAKLGLNLEGIKLNNYSDLHMSPAILHKNSEYSGHFIVIRPLDPNKELVQIIDPINGTYLITFKALKNAKTWSGWALYFTRPESEDYRRSGT